MAMSPTSLRLGMGLKDADIKEGGDNGEEVWLDAPGGTR